MKFRKELNLSLEQMNLINHCYVEHLGCSFEDAVNVYLNPLEILKIKDPSFYLQTIAVSQDPWIVDKLNTTNFLLWSLAKTQNFDLEVPEFLQKKVEKTYKKIYQVSWALNLVNKFDINSLLAFFSFGISTQNYDELMSKCPQFKTQIVLATLVKYAVSNHTLYSFKNDIDNLDTALCSFLILDNPLYVYPFFKYHGFDMENSDYGKEWIIELYKEKKLKRIFIDKILNID